MNITKNIALMIIAAATCVVSVYASAEQSADKSRASVKTRAEVIAEVEQAGGNLARKNYEATFNPAPVRAATKTPVEAKAEPIGSRGDAVRN